MIVPMTSVSAVNYFDGAKMIKTNGYKYYRAWSQDQFPWHNTKPSDAWESDWMNRYGCSTVAMAKMFVEAGVADPNSVNPGTLMTKYGSPSKGIGDVGIYWSTLAGQFGMSCVSFQQYPSGSFYSTAMRYFNDPNTQYHLLLKVVSPTTSSHYVQIDRQATVKQKTLVINDSTAIYDGGTRYNTANDYYNALALKKLSSTNYTACYFVVFKNNNTVKLKSLAETKSTAVTLSWYPNGACEKYTVYKRKEGATSWSGKSFKTFSSSAGEGIRTCTDTDVTPGNTYEYTVTGNYYDSNGKAVYLKYNKTGKSINIETDAPKLLSATSADYDTINVKWQEVKGATGYKVYRKKAGEKDFTALGFVKGTTYRDDSAQVGQEYYYTVRAYVGETSNLGSFDKNGIKGVALPKKPTLKTAESVDFNAIKVTWEKVDGASGYYVYRKADGEKYFKQIAEVNGNKTFSSTDLSATTGVKYQYTVRAYRNRDGKPYAGSYDSKGVTATACTKSPTIKSGVSTVSDKLKLTWSKVNGATGYNVYRKLENDKSYKLLKTINGNGNVEFTDSGLKCGVKYYYRVNGFRTVDSKNYEGLGSKNYLGLTTPAQPALKSAKSLGYNTISIEWTKVEGATGYDIYRKTTGTYSKIGTVDKQSTVTFKDEKAVTGVRYQYTVRAFYNKNGIKRVSTYENYIHGTAYPSNPNLTSVTSVEYNAIELKWDKVDGANGYKIYRKLPSDKNYKELITLYEQTDKYTDQTVTCGTTYQYIIKSFRYENGKIYTSGNNSAVSCKAVPPVVKVKVASTGYNSLNVSWEKVNGATGYRIYFKKDNAKNWTTLATFENGSLTSCEHRKLTTGVNYTYTVRAYYKDGSKTIWGDFNKTGVTKKPVTSAPKLVSVTSSTATNVTVKWETVSGANGYKVMRKADGSKTWSTIGTTDTKKLSYTDKKVTCGVKYRYTVRAYRNVSKKPVLGSYNSNGLEIMTIPDRPVVMVTSSNYNKLNVSWNRSNGATGYKVYRKVVNGTYKLIRNISGGAATGFTDTVECGTEYYYYVTAYVINNKVEYGSFDSEAVKGKAVPQTVKLGSPSTTKGQAKINWSTVPGTTGYYVYSKTGNSGYKLIADVKGGNVKSYTDKNVVSGKKYTYTVKAYIICPAGYISGGYNKTGVTITVK
jgi:fibronectin type 3 domain-containing protein